MPDTKITALAAITTVDPAADVLPIVDISDTSMAASGTTKKITSNQILGAGGTATLASATITGELTVDTSTLKVDSANDRVGIKTATPRAGFALDVLGNVALGDSTTTTSNRLKLDCSGTAGNVAIMSFAAAGTNKAFFGLSGGFLGDTSTDAIVATDAAGAAIRFCVSDTGTEAMRLNSTGLGVGVASPATKLDVNGGTGGIGGQNHATFSGNAGRGLVIGTRSDNVSADRTATLNAPFTGGGIVLQTQGTDRLTLDSSGNVGIGVTPSAWGAGIKAIDISTCGLAGAGIQLELASNSVFTSSWVYKGTGFASRYTQNVGGAGVHGWFTAPSGTAGNAITFTQAMTLDASGNLLVGKTASDSTVVGAELRPSGAIISTLAASTNADFALYTYSTGAGAARFYVGMSGTVFATNTTISAISDARLKENVQDIDVGLGAILALKPRKFDWKEGKGKDIKGDRGFIAQEFEQVFPQLVDEWADPAPEGEAPYKSVRQDLIPVLVKAIQELTARVQTLETR